MIGRTLNGIYTIVRLLGEGGMGAVYEASEAPTGRRVAIKIMRRELANDSSTTRFEREAKVASEIGSEHIVRIFDSGTDPESGSPFMAMEMLDGEDVGQLLKRCCPLPEDLALRIAVQACHGLQRAHEAGVVHRDIKPANLFLARRDDGGIVLKLLDFGVAKVKAAHAAHGEHTGLTRTGSMLGTPLYMSPEQARGLKNIDHRADLWSLGVVLYRMLAGRAPFEDCETFGDLIAAIVTEAPTPIQVVAPWVAPEVASIVHTALQYEPEERFADAAAMREALDELLPDGSALRPEMLVALSDEARAVVAPKLSLTPSPDRPRRRGRASRTDVVPASPLPAAGSAQADAPTRNATTVSAPRLKVVSATVAASAVGATVEVARDTDGGAVPASARPAATAPKPLSTRPAEAKTGDGTAVEARVPPEAARPGAASRAPLALGAAVVLGLGGFGLYSLVRPPAGAAVAVPAASPAGPRPEPPPQLQLPPQPLPAPAAVRRVKLVIVPSDATVEVDGARASATDGVVELGGAPGSVHRVRVLKGKSEVTADVSITEAGALPAKIELSATTAKPAVTAGPAAKPTGAAAASAAPAATSAPKATATATAPAGSPTSTKPAPREQFE